MTHAFTVDLEDWYHGIPIDAARKATAERRLQVGTDHLLDLLERHHARATFFCLAPIAREHPQIVRRLVSAGHDIGSHGESHDLVYEMTPERFRDETRRSIRELEDCSGRHVRCYRAAYFSITRRSLWALDVLSEAGIAFDSSIFPVRNWRYGIPDYSRRPVRVDTAHGPVLEFPLPTRRVLGRNLPATGGAYFRIYPYFVTRANVRALEREGIPVAFYLHPWELDPDHPRVAFHWKPRATHYVNLRSTRRRLERLLTDFRFTTLAEVLLDAFLERVNSYFDREAERFDAIYERDKPLRQRLGDWLFRRVIHERYSLVVNAIGAPGASILDVGCGPGRYGIELARRGAERCVGVDVAAAMIDIARREATKRGVSIRCEWTVSDFLSYSATERFDAVVAMGYFDYLEEPLPHLDRMIGHARGRVFASFPKRWTLRTGLRVVRFKLAGGFVRFYTRGEVLALFREAGDIACLGLVDLGRDYVAIYDAGAAAARAG